MSHPTIPNPPLFPFLPADASVRMSALASALTTTASPRWQGAMVQCRCYEDGHCRSAPPLDDDDIVGGANGVLAAADAVPDDMAQELSTWMSHACEHPDMTAADAAFSDVDIDAWTLLLKRASRHVQRDVRQACRRIEKALQHDVIDAGDVAAFAADLQVLHAAVPTLGSVVAVAVDDEVAMVTDTAPHTLFASPTHVVGSCELGLFVRAKDGGPDRLTSSLAIDDIDAPSVDQRQLQGAWVPDAAATWTVSDRLLGVLHPTAQQRTLQARRRRLSVVVDPMLQALTQLTRIAQRNRRPLLWVR